MSAEKLSLLSAEDFTRTNVLITNWQGYRNVLTPNVKDKIGRLYVEYVLEQGHKAAKGFDIFDGYRKRVRIAQARAQARVEPQSISLINFWKEVRQLAPVLFLGGTDVEFLAEKGKGKTALQLLDSLQGDRPGLKPAFNSPILVLLQTLNLEAESIPI